MKYNKVEAALRTILALVTIYALLSYTTEDMYAPKGEKDVSAQLTGIYFAVVIIISSILYNILNAIRQFKGEGIKFKGLLLLNLIYLIIVVIVFAPSHPQEINSSNFTVIFIDLYALLGAYLLLKDIVYLVKQNKLKGKTELKY